jgi:hypothetical protein
MYGRRSGRSAAAQLRGLRGGRLLHPGALPAHLLDPGATVPGSPGISGPLLGRHLLSSNPPTCCPCKLTRSRAIMSFTRAFIFQSGQPQLFYIFAV